MTEFQELSPNLQASPSLAELDRQEAEAIVTVQQRRLGVRAILRSLIDPLNVQTVTGMDTLEKGRINCAPQDRIGPRSSERVITSTQLTDPTLPFDLRLVERVRKKRMIKRFSTHVSK